ncbi:GLUG motif-containing protein [Methanolapillus millepedarum]|uniref:GLUG domain-containing protein n=1 Tax=Methanolapillus millepedarum TaxID=3028296 RepID=A0AA96V5B9_9EURY|nr:hypothetical protein MsAc7_14240 [Methanosarcinaceae archaeon Ac7]
MKSQSRIRIGIVILVILSLAFLFVTLLVDREPQTSCLSCSLSSQDAGGFEQAVPGNSSTSPRIPPKNVTPDGGGNPPISPVDPPVPPAPGGDPIDADVSLYDYKLWSDSAYYLRVLMTPDGGTTITGSELKVYYTTNGSGGWVQNVSYELLSAPNTYVVKMKDPVLENAGNGKIYTYTFYIDGDKGTETVNYPFESGKGTAANPYMISDVVQMDALRYYTGIADAGKYFELADDIDIPAEWNTGTVEKDRAYADGFGWIPIGTATMNLDDTGNYIIESPNPFSGNLNGQNKTISGLYIYRPFSFMGYPYEDEENNFMGLFGYSEHSKLENLNLENIDVTGCFYTGGLLGHGNNTQIRNVNVSGNLIGAESSGGLLGYATGLISECSAEVNVSDDYIGGIKFGGLIGEIGENTLASNTVENCKAKGDTVALEDVGGLIGRVASSSVIQNCRSEGTVEGRNGFFAVSTKAGGLVGFMNKGVVTDCTSESNVSGNAYVGGLIGSDFKAPVTNCTVTGKVEGIQYVGGLIGGTGLTSTHEANFNLTKCRFTGPSVSGNHTVGGLAGIYVNSTMTNCYSTGDVLFNSTAIYGTSSGITGTGGLVGYLNSSTVLNCYAAGNVTSNNASYAVGGLVGNTSQTNLIENCYSSGNTVSGKNSTGGLVGSVNSDTAVKNCTSFIQTLSTTSPNKGRIAGLSSGTLENNYALGEMTGGTWMSNANGKDGADVSASDAKTKTFYNGLGWSIRNSTDNDNNEIWMIAEGTAYPILSWQ